MGDEFWRALGEPGAADGRFAVSQALVETLDPLRKSQSGQSSQSGAFRGGIRYPLSRGDGTETALESCFWLDLTERRLGRALGNSSGREFSTDPTKPAARIEKVREPG